MKEETYLLRLNSIKEKYGRQSGGQLSQRNQKMHYPLFQEKAYEQKNRWMMCSFLVTIPPTRIRILSIFRDKEEKLKIRKRKELFRLIDWQRSGVRDYQALCRQDRWAKHSSKKMTILLIFLMIWIGWWTKNKSWLIKNLSKMRM